MIERTGPLSIEPPALRRSVVARAFRGRGAGMTKNLWSLADQGVISGGTFLTNLVLARHLRPSEYGVYALLFGAVLFLNSLQASLVLYPLSVAGANADQERLRRLASGSAVITAVCWLPLGAGLVGAAIAAGRPGVAPYAFLALVCTQLQLTVRGAFASQLRFRELLPGDVISYLGQAGCVWVLVRGGVSSAAPIFAAMAVTSIVAAAVQLAQLGLVRTGWADARRLGEDYWLLGRWMVLSSVIGLVTIQAPPWVLAFIHGSHEAASLLIVANVLGVTHPVIFSVSNLIVPAVARARTLGGVPAARRAALHYGIQGGVLIMPYYLGLLALPALVLRAFYGPDSPYRGLDSELRLFAVGYILFYARTPIESLLRGLEQSRLALLIHLTNAAGVAGVVIPMAALSGVLGATGGIAVASLAVLAVSIILVRRVP